MIEWNKRAKRDETQMAERRTWKSKCGHYKVEESNIKYGRSTDRHGNYKGYPIFYRAMASVDGVWMILSAHRKRTTAVAQCEYWHEKGHLMPRQTKAVKATKRAKAKRQAKRKINKSEK